MVKRLRRSPLTAESGVRFPLGSPKKKLHFCSFLSKLKKRRFDACFFFLATKRKRTSLAFCRYSSSEEFYSKCFILPVFFVLKYVSKGDSNGQLRKVACVQVFSAPA